MLMGPATGYGVDAVRAAAAAVAAKKKKVKSEFEAGQTLRNAQFED